MNQKEIDKKIAEEYNDFYVGVYDGSIPVPANLVDLFKKALMVVPPIAHQYPSARVRQMLDKPVEELSWVETGKMVNVIVEAPFHTLYKDIDEALVGAAKIEEFRMNWQAVVAKFDETMKRKREALSNLAGTRKQPMQIIPAEA